MDMKKKIIALGCVSLLASQCTLANPIRITAKQLGREYETNAARADSYYLDKELLVSGKVDRIPDPFSIVLSTGEFLSWIGAEVIDSESNKLLKLSKGDYVTLLCIGNGSDDPFMVAELRNCKITHHLTKSDFEKAKTESKEREEKLKAEKEVREAAEREAKARAEYEAKLKAEQEAKIRAEQERIAKERAEYEEQLKAKKARQEAERKAEQIAKWKAEQEAQRKAVEKANNAKISAFLDGTALPATNISDVERTKFEPKVPEQKTHLLEKTLNNSVEIKSSRYDTDFRREKNNQIDISKLIFQEGLAYFQDHQGLYGFVDHYGRVVIKPQYNGAGGFYNARAVVKDRNSDLWGYIDKQTNWIVKPQFCMAGRFSEGLAAVYIGGISLDSGCRGGKWGFINTKGKIVIPAQFDRVWAFSKINGNILAKFEHGGYTGYINTKGEWVR